MRRAACALLLTCLACARENRQSSGAAVQDSTHRVASISGLAGPEAVRYDEELDVYFVSNFNGSPEGDSNGFVSRARPDGAIDSLRFMVGTAASPLHGPRGMFITGDTLWVADADGVHLFHRRTGAALRFVDFRSFSPGFLNDIVQGPDGAIYITDTGRSRVYRIAGGTPTIAIEDTALKNPNGITCDAANSRFLLASWNPAPPVHTWDGRTGITAMGAAGGGRNDGIELVGDRLLIASQADSSINVLEGGVVRPLIRVPGAPADIGVDTRRSRVAVPYVDLDRVDIWDLSRP
jgi:sugar lactone lactonase YvrE